VIRPARGGRISAQPSGRDIHHLRSWSLTWLANSEFTCACAACRPCRTATAPGWWREAARGPVGALIAL